MICDTCQGAGNVIVGFSPLRFQVCTCFDGVTHSPIGPEVISCNARGESKTTSDQTFSIASLPEHEQTMGHIMAKAGMFKSVSDARRNGWDRPAEIGSFPFKKKRVTITVTA